MPVVGIPGVKPTSITRMPESNPYRTATIVNVDTPLNKMVGFIDGSKWTVDYYNLIRAEDDMVSPLDVNLPNTLAQYMKISNLDIHVTTPIDPSNHPEVSGVAYVTIGIVPSQGDVLKVVIGGGRSALLTVNRVDHKHYNLSDVYEIEYILDSFMDLDPNRLNTLEEKVVRRYVFDTSYIRTNSSPLILQDEAIFNGTLVRELEEIKKIFLNLTLDPEQNFIRVPNQSLMSIDTGVQYCFQFISNLDDNKNLLIDSLSPSYDNEDSIWSKITMGDKRHLKYYQRYMNTNLTGLNSTSAIDGNYYWGGVRKVVVPTKELSINNLETPLITTEYPRAYNVSCYTVVAPEISILPITNGSYLFSENFYNGGYDTISILESLVMQRLNREQLNRCDLERVIEVCRYWSDLDSFYYLPVLMVLLKYGSQNNYVVL